MVVDLGNKIFKPLTITENGTYEGGVKDGKQVGFNPVVVDVKPDKSAVVKEIVDMRKSASHLFNMYGDAECTNETLREYLKYDTTENAESLESTFSGLGANAGLTELPLINTKKVKNLMWCLDYLMNVRVIPAWDLRNATLNTYYFIRYAYNLEEIWVKNITARIVIGYTNEWGTKIKKECLIHTLYECRDTGSANTLYVSYASSEILDSVYVRTIPITDEMRERFTITEGVVIENDDLIDEKLPFVVCESTDEGAIPIKQYALLKNWQIANSL